jgi:hypothetical protein
MLQAASAFMIDLSQVSMMLRGATARSLLVLDEFGKGEVHVGILKSLANIFRRNTISGWSRTAGRDFDRISGKGS